ncbi:MAG: polysaccharide biosynthesis C-terminal domain-containing protein [Vicingaceae bacterium]
MFNKVLLTFSTRIVTALLSVVNVLIGTNYLGVEGYGTVSLIILGITIYLMIQNLLTGSSIVYFISKFKVSSIVIISYAWVLVSVLAFSSLVFGFHMLSERFHWNFEIVPMEYAWHNILLALGFGLMNIHLNILLGRERIKAFNFIFFIQHVLATAFLVIYYVIMGKQEVFYYLVAYYFSYFLSYLISFALTYNYFNSMTMPSWFEFKSMFRYGVLGQSANVLQLINYRLSYYLIDAFVGRAFLGVFSAATQISEGLWILSKSIATVQFARISNSTDLEYARKLSLKLLKFTVTITAFPLLFLMLVPKDFYQFLLGDEFNSVRLLIRLMALGTISLTASQILSHYFSGTGRIGKNTLGSGVGVFATVILGFSLIPFFGLKAAALVSSISYFTSMTYLLIQLNKEGKLKLKDFLISRSDIVDSYRLLMKQRPNSQ